MRKQMLVIVAIAQLAMACNDTATTGSTGAPFHRAVVTMSGSIADTVAAFRTLLGTPNGAVAGEQTAGRREINWDGAAANAFDNTNSFPADFFNTVAKVGAVFTTDGTGFRNDSTLFVDINPTYANELRFFSANKIFAPVGSNVLDVLFQVAGQPTPAVSNGFGIVFSDVDVANATKIELFAQDGSSLGVVAAPVRSDTVGLSFIGVSFNAAVIARVRVTLGTGALASDANDVSEVGGVKDVVVLDNLIYGEPKKAF